MLHLLAGALLGTTQRATSAKTGANFPQSLINFPQCHIYVNTDASSHHTERHSRPSLGRRKFGKIL
jgi:hypothetical protein